MDLPFECGFKLYLKCINNIKQENEKEVKNHIRQVWLIELQHGYKGNFEKYYNSKVSMSKDRTMKSKEKDYEEERIIKDITKKKDVKLKERKIIL